MTIANRILLGFASLIGLMLAVGLFAIVQIGGVREASAVIVTRDMAVLRHAGALRQLTDDLRQTGDAALYARDGIDRSTEWRSQGDDLDAAFERAIQTAAAFRGEAVSTDRAQAWERIESQLRRTAIASRQGRTEFEALLSAVRANNDAEASETQLRLNAARSQVGEGLSSVEALAEDAVQAGQERIERAYQTSRVALLVLLLVACVVAGVVAWLVRRSIVKPLDAFMLFVERVGRGDLTGQADDSSGDELGRLGKNLNAMVEGLRDLARRSREATESLNAATAEIRASTQEQAASVEEQLAAVQETAATVDEITHSGAQIGKRAHEVIAAAQATAQTSEDGLKAVEDTVHAMDAIRDQAEAVAQNVVALSEKTQAIGDIIATVNDVSERSHLLALNAAIEAAAAGEQGRSFAVVAAELKMLADQAKEATAQVRAILGEIQRGINTSVMLTEEAVKRVGAGRERTQTTQQTIHEITARFQEGVQTFQQIVASTNQQQLGIEQVMGALQSIRDASQQTAASTRQLDEAAGDLNSQSRQLLSLAERYQV